MTARRRKSSAADANEKIALLERRLNEALEQQTATSEVLRVISSSPGELEPVFQAILANAVRICEAKFGVLFRYDGRGAFQAVAWLGASPDLVAFLKRRGSCPAPVGTPLDRLLQTRKVVEAADESAEATPGATARLDGARSLIAVPMLKDNDLVGAIIIYRQEVRPFIEKQIELVKNFAAQAVIAIENTRLLNELRQRTDDLSEALEQQTATSEVLGVISSSPGELRPVFEAMLENATRICEAKFGNLMLWEGDGFRAVAVHGEAAFAERRRQQPKIAIHPGLPLTRLAATKAVVHIPDFRLERVYIERLHAHTVELVEIGGARTLLAVPMLKDDELVGAIILYRTEVRQFTNKQIELVTNFAHQAVIAIENARLLNELRESLEQQTATSDVLKVIASSTGELELVFDAMLENAVRICEAKFGNLWLYEDDCFRIVGFYGPQSTEYRDRLKELGTYRPGEGTGLARLVKEKRVVQIEDLSAGRSRDPLRVASVEIGGTRTLLAVPMLKDGKLIGSLAIYRQEVRPFTDKQIELVKNFATQAVVAIENTRLLNELRQRTDDLTESLEQQTATAEVLKVISSSPGDLEPVFEAMLQNSVGICEAGFGQMFLREGGDVRLVATVGVPTALVEFDTQRGAFQPSAGGGLDQVIRTKQVAHIADLAAEHASYPPARLGGARSYIAVPMLREGELVGAIAIYRQEVRPFTDKQIALVQNFATQAVIAIENARLLNELREALERQTATSQVLQVISSSPGELEPVFQAMLENATRICAATFGNLLLYEGDAFRRVAMHNAPQAMVDEHERNQIIPRRSAPALNRLARTRQVIHIADVASEIPHEPIVKFAGARSFLIVPMLKESELIGAIGIYRQEVRPFTDKQIDLVQSFAAQAVIAIENARLLNELRQRTDDLSQSLEDLRTTQDRLVQTEKLASLGQLTAGIAHEIKNPLNFVNNFSGVSVEMIDELQDAFRGVPLNDKLRAEIIELIDTLRSNLDKVIQHGKRADAIVKNMLLHSRQGSGEHRPVDINALVEESLNLAYHGARAEKQGFNITLERSLDPSAGEVDVFPQDITRVLLNLISNGFYAATKRKAQADGADYEPTLMAATRNLGDSVEIRIRDNGTGIPPEVKEKMFNPFFTTKPAGEGTGLGLSISHDIIVKQHGGSIEVDTQPGEFTEIKITLPRSGVFAT